MFKKCKANCQANDNLYMRGDIFYYMVELPRKNGKRRYFIKSLHTKNYYEALEKARNMAKNLDLTAKTPTELIATARHLMDKIIYEDSVHSITTDDGRILTTTVKRISAKTDLQVIQDLYDVIARMTTITDMTDDEKQEMLAMITQVVNTRFDEGFAELKVYLQNLQINTGSGAGTPPKIHTIRELRDAWIQHENNGKAEKRKKELFFEHMAKKIGLTIDSDYAEFNSESKINDIIHEIKINPKWSTDATKGKKVGYLKSLYDYVDGEYPGMYRNFKNRYPIYKKGESQNPHMPYSDMDLKEIFNPAHNHFKDNPDDFWVILMGMFAGARTNAAATIKYQDIVNIDGCFCIHFNKGDDKNKHLKTEATIRLLPIPQQLLDLGFIDWVQRKKKRLNAQDDDQIFTNAINSKGNYNNKYVSDQILPFVRSLNLSKPYKGKLDFHSFRNNASLQLQDIFVPQSYINNIMGWKGQTIMEQHYSKHSLSKIKIQADKLRYDFLQPEFDYWKEVMSKI